MRFAKFSNKVGRLAVVALALTILAGCSSLKQQLTDKVSFRLEGIDMAVSVHRGNSLIPDIIADLAVEVEITNDSLIALTLMQMNYQVLLRNSVVGQGASQDQVKVAANGGRNTVILNIALSGKELLAEGFNLTRDNNLPPLRIEGAGIVNSPIGRYNIPFTLRFNEQSNTDKNEN